MVPALRVPSPLPAPAPSDAGAMILVPGVVAGVPAYTVKVHAEHPGRDPAIQGVIILSSLETGKTLAIMESGFLTVLRTGLAGAIGADVLARRDARTVAIVGAGAEGILDQNTKQQIEKVIAAYHEDWNKPDAAGIASFYTKDGVLVTSDVKAVKNGSQEIAEDYQNLFKTGITHMTPQQSINFGRLGVTRS
jgi:hypothetical protein